MVLAYHIAAGAEEGLARHPGRGADRGIFRHRSAPIDRRSLGRVGFEPGNVLWKITRNQPARPERKGIVTDDLAESCKAGRRTPLYYWSARARIDRGTLFGERSRRLWTVVSFAALDRRIPPGEPRRSRREGCNRCNSRLDAESRTALLVGRAT